MKEKMQGIEDKSKVARRKIDLIYQEFEKFVK